MLADIAALSPQAAAAWAGQMLASKNRLTAEDARAVEQAFEARFAALDEDLVEVLPLVPSEAQPIAPVYVLIRRRAEQLEIPRPAHPRMPGRVRPRRPPLPAPRPPRRSAKPCGTGTRSICGSFEPSPASSAAGSRPIRTTFALPSRRRSAARSATSSPFRSAAPITARRIGRQRKRSGGSPLGSRRSRSPKSFGSNPGRRQTAFCSE